MQPSLLSLASFVASTSALTMRPPWFIDILPLTEIFEAFTLAGKSSAPVPNPAAYCSSLTDIVMDQGSLPPPSTGLTLYHVAVGRGTQNYSCPTDDTTAPSAVPTPLGATATLYNVTCLMAPKSRSIFETLFKAVANSKIPKVDLNAPWESGHHYFTNGATTATFNLHQPSSYTGNLGISFSSKTNSTAAPATALDGTDSSKPVPWLKLTTIGFEAKPSDPVIEIAQADQVGGVKEIYRVNTAGGAAPAVCGKLRGDFQQEYAAEYWFWH